MGCCDQWYFWLRVVWFDNNFASDGVMKEYRCHLTSFTTAHISFYFLQTLTWSKIHGKWWKRSPTHRFTIVVCGGPMEYDLVTSHKHLLWRHFAQLPPERFKELWSWSYAFSYRRKNYHHSLIIKPDSQPFHWLACKTNGSIHAYTKEK